MYAELECKTNYSFLRGASRPEELIVQAFALGLPALAINDYDGIYGIPKAYWEKKKFPQLQLIVGASLNLENHPRLTVLAKNRQGYGSLCRMLTASHEGRAKASACLSWERLEKEFSQLDGLIFLVSQEAQLAKLLPHLRPENIFLKIHRFLDGFDQERQEKVEWLSRRWKIPLVATNDVHFHSQARKPLQDVLVGIRQNTPLQKLGHELFPNAERVLKSPGEMQQLFADLPEALENTLRISASCTFCPSELRYRYPSEWIPAGESAQSYLQKITYEGAKIRFPQKLPEKSRRRFAMSCNSLSS